MGSMACCLTAHRSPCRGDGAGAGGSVTMVELCDPHSGRPRAGDMLSRLAILTGR